MRSWPIWIHNRLMYHDGAVDIELLNGPTRGRWRIEGRAATGIVQSAGCRPSGPQRAFSAPRSRISARCFAFPAWGADGFRLGGSAAAEHLPRKCGPPAHSSSMRCSGRRSGRVRDRTSACLGPRLRLAEGLLARFASDRPEFVERLLAPQEAAAGAVWSNKHSSWYGKATLFAHVAQQLAPASFERMLAAVEVTAAGEGWISALHAEKVPGARWRCWSRRVSIEATDWGTWRGVFARNIHADRSRRRETSNLLRSRHRNRSVGG